MKDPNEGKEFRFFDKQAFDACHTIALSWAFPLLWVIRNGMGSDMPGLYGLYATVLMLMYWTTHAPYMQIFIVISFLCLARNRFNTYRLERRGYKIHSKCLGYPWLATKIPFVNTESKGLNAEPPLCVMGGSVLYAVDEVLGTYIVLAGFALLYIEVVYRVKWTRMRRVLDDAAIEAQRMAEELDVF